MEFKRISPLVLSSLLALSLPKCGPEKTKAEANIHECPILNSKNQVYSHLDKYHGGIQTSYGEMDFNNDGRGDVYIVGSDGIAFIGDGASRSVVSGRKITRWEAKTTGEKIERIKGENPISLNNLRERRR